MLQINDIHKSYGDKPALRGVTLTIEPGEICGLLGPNGAGKTTLASIVAGLKRPDQGTVVVDGIDVIAHPYDARDRLGYAPQDLGIYPLTSVRDNLSTFGALAGLRGRSLKARVEEVASLLGLSHLLDRVAGLMSGGEQRRLHAGMALLHRPKVLLLDEPTVAADVETRTRLLEFVQRLADEGTAICYSTHYLTEVEDLDATVALIDQGQIVARGGVRELIDKHADAIVELRFAAAVPVLPLADKTVQIDGDRLRIVTKDPTGDAAAVLALAADHHASVVGVDLIRPSLDTVFLALTGSRITREQQEAPYELAS